MPIVINLEKILYHRKLSYPELADKMNVSENKLRSYNNILVNKLDDSNLKLLLAALSCSVGDLAEFVDNEH